MSTHADEERLLDAYPFVEPKAAYPISPTFDFGKYINTEREFWALFPETDGKRVNFVQAGVTAQIFAESPNTNPELDANETYILLPCEDLTIRPIRMSPYRRLTLREYRMAQHTCIKLIGEMREVNDAMREIGNQILGQEVRDATAARIAELNGK